ncbi:hypothetical protein [Streptomyces alkaliterrae]|uniref:Uncharacterized protein n=1 Tax=Streptomyces alkaliterrae TaxID=2213162 RepID=A0A5P0YQD4_9ACTN|nr:hypothetical protein [Streptomyces alkaliterrae]MBB1259046.1 hypothetical protein [Streptomyces alkaliterrae]MQS02468.1 hypothetical protein [Streptomyces alkaliterrae]
MPPVPAGLHLSLVLLEASHRVCAIWRVSGAADPRTPCEFPGALLLPRRGAEQDWAVDTALTALHRRGVHGPGPACVDLAVTADGITPAALRVGLCAERLRALTRDALGEDQADWAALAHRDPAAFRTAADRPYVVRRPAAALAVPGPDGLPHRAEVVDRRPEPALRAYTAAVSALAERPEPAAAGRDTAHPGATPSAGRA